MGVKSELDEDWGLVTSSATFSVQVLTTAPGEFTVAATLPAETVDGVLVSRWQVANNSNLSGSGNLYGRTYGQMKPPCGIVLLT